MTRFSSATLMGGLSMITRVTLMSYMNLRVARLLSLGRFDDAVVKVAIAAQTIFHRKKGSESILDTVAVQFERVGATFVTP